MPGPGLARQHHFAAGWHSRRLPGVLQADQQRRRREPMATVNLIVLQPLVALIAGILILVIPRLLNYVVALYLIIIGLIGLYPHLIR
jgi:hypothetical protein